MNYAEEEFIFKCNVSFHIPKAFHRRLFNIFIRVEKSNRAYL